MIGFLLHIVAVISLQLVQRVRLDTVDLQSAANLIALCRNDMAGLPLSNANSGALETEINIFERELLMCLLIGDLICAEQDIQRLKSMRLGQGRGGDFVKIYEDEVNALREKKRGKERGTYLTAVPGPGSGVRSLLRARKYVAVENIIKKVDDEDNLVLLFLAYMLFRFPGVFYSPISSRALLKGDTVSDTILLVNVLLVSGYSDERLEGYADGIRELMEQSKDVVLIANSMYIHLAAGKTRIASKYADMLLDTKNIYHSDALAIKAATFLCGETNGLGIQTTKHAKKLYKQYIDLYGDNPSFIKAGNKLANNFISWEDAQYAMESDHKNEVSKAPSIKTVPVLPLRNKLQTLALDEQTTFKLLEVASKNPSSLAVPTSKDNLSHALVKPSSPKGVTAGETDKDQLNKSKILNSQRTFQSPRHSMPINRTTREQRSQIPLPQPPVKKISRPQTQNGIHSHEIFGVKLKPVQRQHQSPVVKPTQAHDEPFGVKLRKTQKRF